MNRPASLIADLLVRLDPDLRYQFEERAGIMEFDGGLSRDEAEALALVDLLRPHPGALVGLAALQVENRVVGHRHGFERPMCQWRSIAAVSGEM